MENLKLMWETLQQNGGISNNLNVIVPGLIFFGSLLGIALLAAWALFQVMGRDDPSAPLAAMVFVAIVFTFFNFPDINGMILGWAMTTIFSILWIMNKVGRIYDWVLVLMRNANLQSNNLHLIKDKLLPEEMKQDLEE